MKLLFTTLAVAGLVYTALCVLVFFFQHRLVYFPGPPPQATPDQAGLEFEEVFLTTQDGVRIHGWFLPAERTRGTVLVCHGNAGDISMRLVIAAAFLRMGFSVFLLEYRGFGKSEGRPSEAGTYLDAESAYDYLRSDRGLPSDGIVVYGESLGAAVAVELARRREVAALVLESAFLSIPEVGAHAYPLLPVKWLARIRYDNRAKIANLRLPILFVHSQGDEIVPFEHGRQLYELASGDKELLETRGGHNDGGFLAREEWRETVRRFLERTIQTEELAQ